MSMTEREFIEIKEKIEKKKEDVTRATGKREQLMESLKNDYGCETVDQAKEKLEQLNAELEEKSAGLEDLETSLREAMEMLSA